MMGRKGGTPPSPSLHVLRAGQSSSSRSACSLHAWAADGKTEIPNLLPPPCRPASPHFMRGTGPGQGPTCCLGHLSLSGPSSCSASCCSVPGVPAYPKGLGGRGTLRTLINMVGRSLEAAGRVQAGKGSLAGPPRGAATALSLSRFGSWGPRSGSWLCVLPSCPEGGWGCPCRQGLPLTPLVLPKGRRKAGLVRSM